MISSRSLISIFTRDLKCIIWVNTIIFSMIISIFLLGFEGSVLITVLSVIIFGVIVGTVNHIFINSYYTRKTKSKLVHSYEKLQESLLFDDLTGTYNRRTGMIRLHEEFARCKRIGSKLSVAMVDVDAFKKINDTYGHQSGDYVLKHIASDIKSWLREPDVVFRYGGEEFLIILPDTNKEQAFFPLDRLRQNISNQTIDCGSSLIKTSISIGVAATSGIEADESEIIRYADQALYNAKRSGRNKVLYEGAAHTFDYASGI